MTGMTVTGSSSVRRERQLILVVLTSALLLLLVLAVFALRALDNQESKDRLFEESFALTNAFEMLLSNVKDAETGQRGFLITREAEYLEPYSKALGTLPAQIMDLDGLMSKHPEYQAQWDEAKSLIRRKLGTLNGNVSKKQSIGAVDVDKLREGKAVMDGIRRVIGALIEQENAVLHSRRELRDAGVASTFKWMGFLAGVAVLLTGMAGMFIYRDRRMIAQNEALLESEDRLRMAMTAGHLGSWDWNVLTGDVVWDETCKAIFGIPKDLPMTYALFLQHVHPHDRERVDVAVKEALAKKAGYEVEMRATLPDGSIRWLQSKGAVKFDVDGKPVRMSGVAQDITERKTMETRLQEWSQELERRVTKRTKELLESEQRLAVAQQAAGIGMFDWNLRTGVDVWTAELEALYGLKPGEFALSQLAWESLIHPDDRVHALFLVEESRRTGAAAQGEWRVIWPDGSLHWIAGRWRVLKDESGDPMRMTGINIDITERKLNEVALEESAHQLRRLATELNLAEQRERKRLATDLHDHLQQLLVTCKLKLKLAHGKRLGQEDDESVRHTTETDELLAEALNYTRTLVAELSPPVLSEQGLGRALIWLGEYMKRYGLVVAVSVPERRVSGLPEDQAVLVFQSIRELLFNASKHAGTHEAWVTLEHKEGALRIEVRDNGVGFVPSSLSAPNETSSKFGLFSIRERMSALGGSLHITSSPEVGTRAVLLLPLSKPTHAPPSLSATRAIHAIKEYRPKEGDRMVKVLLVDDHAMVRQGLRAILEGYPDLHVIGEAVDGSEALEAVRVLRPDVVVIDVNMPVMDGIEATKCIKQECPDTVVVGLSVNAGQDNREAMMSAGAEDLLTKEAAVEELHASIMKALKPSFPITS